MKKDNSMALLEIYIRLKQKVLDALKTEDISEKTKK